MNKDQSKLIDALLATQECIKTPTFMLDKNGYDNIAYYFDRLVDSVRIYLGNQQIKEYLSE